VSVRFGPFELDPAARELRREGWPVRLGPRALDLLSLLVAERPRALSKQELAARLWPDTFVSGTSLAQVVTELRKALGDSRRKPLYVRTVFGYGYAFCAEAGPAPASASSAFSLRCGPREIPLPEGETVLGRGPGVGVPLSSESASRRHARVVVRGARATIEDLGSKNGTFVDGRRVERAVPITGGSVVTIGGQVLTVVTTAPAGSTRTEASGRRE
jgi:DNA-binding winged helix-turn-helix (wHTH) protein